MRLVMFDVDGTLVRDDVGIDNSCYVEAVKDIFGVQHIDTE